MIGYAPLVDIPDDMITASPVTTTPSRRHQKKENDSDDSECNYLVMFFILGMVALAMTDMMSGSARK